jgi:Flp pilus assembly protein TadG
MINKFNKQRGALLLEYAITLPIFLGIIFVSADLVRILYQSVSLNYSLATASRWAILQGTVPDPANPGNFLDQLSSVKYVVKQSAQKLGLNLTDQEIHLCQASQPNCTTETAGSAGARMVLSVTKPTRMVTGAQIDLKSSVVFRNE